MYGLRAHRAVLAAGVRISGASVHFVDDEYDRGPIIAQWPVPVLDDDTPERLAARVLEIEHALYPRAVDALAAGRIALDTDDRARLDSGGALSDAAFALARADRASVVRSIDRLFGGGH
jgi:folate-dependent phosphoribosylglycinamide formyltransferase PurN